MTSVLIFEFDKIFNKIPAKVPETIRDICFSPLPEITWKPDALKMITDARYMDVPVILMAYEEERYLKEALFGAGFCPYFDHFIFLNELGVSQEQTGNLIIESLYKRFGMCKSYLYLPEAAVISDALKLLLRQAPSGFQILQS